MTTVNDIALDQITGHSVDLLRVDAGLREKILDALNVLEENLVKKLEKAKLHEVKKTATQRKRLEKLLSQTKKTISTAYNDIDKIEDKELIDLARVAEKQAVRTINTAIKASTLSVGMSKEMLESIGKDTLITGAPSKEWWQRQSQTFESTFKDTVRQGLLSGKPTAEIVRELMGTKTARYKDGKLEPRRRGAEALVRTSVQVVANEARMQTYENNNDIVKGIEWVSTLDSRTSPICRVLDGLMWDNERKPINHSKSFPGATAHWNCRSTQVPILKSWEELGAKKKFKEIPEGTRASMDGQVSAKEGYEDWLIRQGKEKGEKFQKDILGKGKWELWKAGKVGFTDLVDQTGNSVSLEVLREKLGIEKAGGKKLKLSVAQNQEALSSALKDFESVTSANPLGGKARITQDGTAIVKLDSFGDAVWIDEIRAIEKGKGAGASALREAKRIADKHGVPLRLNPKQIGFDGMSSSQLRDWYSRNGFKELPDGSMEYFGEKVGGTQIGGGFANSTLEKMWRGDSTPQLQRILKTYEDDLYKAGSREGASDPRDWDRWVEHKKFIEDELANRGAKLKPKAARKVVPVTPDKKLTDEAFKYYGETGMASDTGYIMADGRQLDLSGANQGGTPGIRALDHRDVTRLEGMKTPGDEPTKSMFEFQNRTGAIRTHVSNKNVYVSLTTKPTDEAFDKLMLLVEVRGGGLVLDVDNGKTLGTIASREWDKVKPSEVRRFIDEALGRKSLKSRYFLGKIR